MNIVSQLQNLLNLVLCKKTCWKFFRYNILPTKELCETWDKIDLFDLPQSPMTLKQCGHLAFSCYISEKVTYRPTLLISFFFSCYFCVFYAYYTTSLMHKRSPDYIKTYSCWHWKVPLYSGFKFDYRCTYPNINK